MRAALVGEFTLVYSQKVTSFRNLNREGKKNYA